MKLWIDDIRKPPSEYELHAKSYSEAVFLLTTHEVTHLSFDHDLGANLSGYDIATYIEHMAAQGLMGRMTWEVHSANPVGRKNIIMAMQSAERFWNRSVG